MILISINDTHSFRGNVVVDYYACQDMPEHLKQWAFDLVKDNMYDM